MIKLKLSTDFSDTPGGRFIDEGDYSGELFRDSLLIKKVNDAEEKGDFLEIDFDGCYGIGTSFLEESFGGLVRKYHKRNLLNRMRFISTEDETIPGNIEKYIKKAEEEDA